MVHRTSGSGLGSFVQTPEANHQDLAAHVLKAILIRDSLHVEIGSSQWKKRREGWLVTFEAMYGFNLTLKRDFMGFLSTAVVWTCNPRSTNF